MKYPIIFLAAAGIATLPAWAAPITKDQYKDANKNIDATYKTDKAQCTSMKGNAKDICQAQAKAKQKTDKAQAEADYKDTVKAHQDAMTAKADGDYSVAKEKCDDQSGNAKDVCIKQAKDVMVHAKADAKAYKKTTDARIDANQDKNDADYKVAAEKCDAMSSAVKDKCIKDAKARYGKS